MVKLGPESLHFFCYSFASWLDSYTAYYLDCARRIGIPASVTMREVGMFEVERTFAIDPAVGTREFNAWKALSDEYIFHVRKEKWFDLIANFRESR